MNTTPQTMSAEMAADLARWQEKNGETLPAPKPVGVITSSLRAEFEAMMASWPEPQPVPFELTLEGERLKRFKAMCPPEFMQRIDRALLKCPDAFDRVAKWDGKFPGPIAWGPTSTGKSRAAWSALARLWVRESRGFTTFTARRLVTEYQRYEDKGFADEFYHQQRFFHAILVDDIDKINWQFESQGAALFAFYDWVYAKHIPVITTTNHGRAWWANKMGDAFTRRLFEGAHFEVSFSG